MLPNSYSFLLVLWSFLGLVSFTWSRTTVPFESSLAADERRCRTISVMLKRKWRRMSLSLSVVQSTYGVLRHKYPLSLSAFDAKYWRYSIFRYLGCRGCKIGYARSLAADFLG